MPNDIACTCVRTETRARVNLNADLHLLTSLEFVPSYVYPIKLGIQKGPTDERLLESKHVTSNEQPNREVLTHG